MPRLARPLTNGEAVVDLLVGVHLDRVRQLQAAGRPVPVPVVARTVFDTWATTTMIDESVLAPIGLIPTGMTDVHTPSTGGTPLTCLEFYAHLALLDSARDLTTYDIGYRTVIASDLTGTNTKALIG